MGREIARRLERLEVRRQSKTLRTGVVMYPPDATEEQIEALVQEHLRGLPASPSLRILILPEQYETCEEWEATNYE